MTRAEIVNRIMKCAVCGKDLNVTDDQKSAVCNGERKHCFDFSKDGYLSLPLSHGGDSKAAVDARRSFLQKGYYSPVARAVADTVKMYVPDNATIIDAGCGEGYYTSMLSEKAGCVLGFDLSKFACALGSKSAKREGMNNILYSTASVFELPVKDGAADAVVNIFAPCAEEEYNRILRDGGYLFVVSAGKDHLMGLKRAIYDEVYENGQRADMPEKMKLVETVNAKHKIHVEGNSDLEALFSMTPYYWRTSEADKAKLKEIDDLETEIEFEINVYQK